MSMETRSVTKDKLFALYKIRELNNGKAIGVDDEIERTEVMMEQDDVKVVQRQLEVWRERMK